jgi:hypothetical protein
MWRGWVTSQTDKPTAASSSGPDPPALAPELGAFEPKLIHGFTIGKTLIQSAIRLGS